MGPEHIRATRDGTEGCNDATYIMAYLPGPRRVLLATARIAGQRLRVWWYDPRTGQAQAAGEVANAGVMEFAPPCIAEKEDWVVVVDDAQCGYPAPGSQQAAGF
jgi:hypothetical protein